MKQWPATRIYMQALLEIVSTFLFLLLRFFKSLSFLSTRMHSSVERLRIRVSNHKKWDTCSCLKIFYTYPFYDQTYYQSDSFLGPACVPFQHLIGLCTPASFYQYLFPVHLFSVHLPSTSSTKISDKYAIHNNTNASSLAHIQKVCIKQNLKLNKKMVNSNNSNVNRKEIYRAS